MQPTVALRNHQAGFSLVELLIVVMVLAILAGIAIPSYLNSVQRAREVACIGYMKQWPQAQIQYYAQYNKFADTDEILVLDKYIGVGLGAGYRHQGYDFQIRPIPGDPMMKSGWEGTGSPVGGGSNKRYFFIDHTGVIRWRLGATATKTSPALGQ
jgi:prepilin-type N-terminal cleavage/methylation domain-containing protein